jgi:hypothetical protein
LLGAAGEALGYDRHLKSNTSKKRTHSLFRQGVSQKHALGLMTCHLRAALLPKQDIYIFAPGNLGVRRDEMVAQLALAHDCTCLVEGLSWVSSVPKCRVEKGVTKIGPLTLSWQPNDE